MGRRLKRTLRTFDTVPNYPLAVDRYTVGTVQHSSVHRTAISTVVVYVHVASAR